MNKNVWLLPQNSGNMQQFFTTLKMFGEMNGISREYGLTQTLMKYQSMCGLYNPYIAKSHYDVSSANHKIDEPRFYGAIYETSNKKIHVSSYGELLLKYMDDVKKRNMIFIAMLYSVQFNNPYKKMENFDIYPIRLIFELLLDKDLNYQLTNLEVAFILYNVKNIPNIEYYNLIKKNILTFRNLSNLEKKIQLDSDAAQFIKNYVSCNYLYNMLDELNIANYYKEDDCFFVKSPLRAKPTNIAIRIMKLNNDYIEFVKKYKEQNTIFEETKKIRGLRSDWIREIYNSVPNLLLEEIGEKDSVYTEYLQIPKLLLETSIDSTKWSLFEDYITKSFALFDDVRSEKIGGPGQPDTLCHYITGDLNFVADGKSTSKKLGLINDGRLKQHRNKYNAEYTIIVTPEYVPSALEDIKGTKTCIITSYCFSDLITKYIFKLYKNHEECSYKIFNDLIMKNLGTDLSEKIYKIIDERMGIPV